MKDSVVSFMVSTLLALIGIAFGVFIIFNGIGIYYYQAPKLNEVAQLLLLVFCLGLVLLGIWIIFKITKAIIADFKKGRQNL